jgi:hypothetical protein
MAFARRSQIWFSVFALVIGALALVIVLWSRQFSSFRLAEVKATPVIETRLSGEQIIYQTYHVAVDGYPEATEADMYAYAERIFSDQVRGMADRDRKSQVWITFYLERVHINGQEKIRTFRIIFANESNGWQRLEPKGARHDST